MKSCVQQNPEREKKQWGSNIMMKLMQLYKILYLFGGGGSYIGENRGNGKLSFVYVTFGVGFVLMLSVRSGFLHKTTSSGLENGCNDSSSCSFDCLKNV